MQRLTKAEEEVMQVIWRKERCLVSDILDEMEQKSGKRPPHSTISSIVRILEKKGFVGHKAYGRTYEYFPLVSKGDYSRRSLHKLVKDYFDGSVNKLVSFLVREEKLSPDELADLLDRLKEKE
ncbi:MAG: BlaI/MecI/CopY family transcriptional regulator [Bacteroidetes bacterium]|nr:MAG: BlaI/MecI/CopY family transcriptional regulator [Bacteroidota bacterium]